MLLLVLSACGPAKDVADTGAPETDVGVDSDETDTGDTAETDSGETDTGETDTGETDTGPADVDADGYHDVADGGDDCDDLDADVNPGAEEICEDGVDNNCDGLATGCRRTGEHLLADSFTRFTGTAAGEYLGAGSTLGELDGDGQLDVALLSTATVWVFHGSPRPIELFDTDAEIRIPGFGFACAAAAADLDGDGVTDLVVGDIGSGGEASLFLGPLRAGLDRSDRAAAITTTDANGYLGYAVATAELDGDSLPELLIGDPGYDADGARMRSIGAVHVFLDAPSADTPAIAADVTLYGDGLDAYTAIAIAAGSDISGDGVGDLLVGSPGFGTSRAEGGAVYVCTDLVPGTSAITDCTATYRGIDGDMAGSQVDFAGDQDGDGLADVAIGSPPAILGDGRVQIVLSPPKATTWLETADATIVGDADEYIGFGTVRGLGDVDADGFGDLAFVGPYEQIRSASGSGVVHVAYGPILGTISASDVALHLVNDAGGAIEQGDIDLGDATGDGIPDMLISAGFAGAEVGAGWLVDMDPR
jgi:hypothetical protein